ncbi:hypothetical protein HDU86_000481 [Geranomyces michiganensis]|nr:hypothetical protein HDU86_000481 [Geranomyces michiganensis]
MSGPPPVQPIAPIRFADYFFQSGLNPAAKLSDRRILEDGSAAGDPVNLQKRADAAASTEDTSSPLNLPETKLKKKQHPLEWKFGPEILCRYPETDYSEKDKFPTYLSMFCFPDNVQLRHEDNGPLPEKYHSFIVTEETGAKIYGVCVTIYERLHPNHASELEAIAQDLRSGALGTTDLEYIQHIQSELAAKQEALLHARMGMSEPSPTIQTAPTEPFSAQSAGPPTEQTLSDVEEKVKLYRDLLAPLNTLLVDVDNVYVPRCLGVLSHWPWHDFLKDWLCEVVRVTRGDYEECPGNKCIAPLERFIANLIHEVPLPPPGKLEISLRVGQLHLYASRPPVNTISVLKNFSLYPLFRALSVQHVVLLFELALSEQKIIFLSSHLAMLAVAAESLCHFFFPLSWQHITIPVLPARLMSYLQVPMPYIIGVHREYFTPEMQDEYRPPDANVVDLDSDTITLAEQPPSLPVRERQKLVTRLEKATGVMQTSFASPHRTPAPLPPQPAKRLDRGVPLTVQYALPLNKHAPMSCDSARKTPTEKPASRGMLGRARTHTEALDSNRMRGTLTSSPSSAGVAGAWLDKIQKTFSTNPSSPSVMGVSSDSISSSSSTATAEDKNAAWWQRNRDARKQSSDQQSIVSSSGPGFHRSYDEHESDSLGSSEKPLTDTSESSSNPRLRSPFSSKPEKRGMKHSGSNASIASMFSTFSNNRGFARPPGISTNKASNRYSYAGGGGSTASSSVMSTPSSIHYASYAHTEEGISNGLQGVPVRKKEGHSFYSLAVRSPWSANPPNLEDQSNLGSMDGNRSSTTSMETSLADIASTADETARPRNAAEMKRPPRAFSFKSRPKRLDSAASDVISPAAPIRAVQARRRSSVAQSPVISLELGATCRACREDLSEGENATIMQCDSCPARIHPSCLPLMESHPCPAHFDERKIQMAFLKVFTSLLRHYRQHIATPEQLRALAGDAGPGSPASMGSVDSFKALDMDSLGEEWFRKTDFLAGCEKESRPFMTKFVETQAFAQFTLDRVERPESDYEVLFFDECIKEKRNRSKLRLGKESTPFLHETAYDVKSTISCLEVRGPDEGENYKPEGIPIYLDSKLLKSPRVIQPLVTQADHRIMRSMTNELVQRARIASNMKRKQDFSKWMKTKWKHLQKIGGGEVVALGFLSDEQRRELFEERVHEVTSVIDHYEQLHLSTQTPAQIRSALVQLHAQNLVLMRAADEEQLVDENEQADLQGVYMRLFRVITIYEDFVATLKAAGTDVGDEDYLKQIALQEAPTFTHLRAGENESSFKLNLSVGTDLNFGSVSEWLHKVGVDADPGADGHGVGCDDEHRPDDSPDASSRSSIKSQRLPAPPRSDSIRSSKARNRPLVSSSPGLDASSDIVPQADAGSNDRVASNDSVMPSVKPLDRQSIDASADIVNTRNMYFDSVESVVPVTLSEDVDATPDRQVEQSKEQTTNAEPEASLSMKTDPQQRIVPPPRSNSATWEPSRDAGAGS